MKFLIGMTLLITTMLLTGCGASMVNQWSDDYSNLTGFKGGIFSYRNHGASAIIQSRYNDGISKSREYCGDRLTFFQPIGSKNVTSTMLTPTFQTTNFTGAIYTSGGFGSFSGSSFTQGITTTIGVTTYEQIQFLCIDNDIKQGVFILTSKSNAAPVCTEIKAPWTPGERRISTVANAETSANCVTEEGWIRFSASDDSGKFHVFIGETGKQLCKKIEDEIVDSQIANANLYLRKRLTCKKQPAKPL